MSLHNSLQSNKRGPDFIGIGAARSGTTWLAKQLGTDKQVWMPKRKELHYFSRSPDYRSPSCLFDESLMKRIIGLESRNIVFKRKLIAALGGSLLSKDFERLSWELRYFLGDSSMDWYSSLFPNDDRITGEITPAYALLHDNAISNIVRMNPNIKIIYIIRNPVERAWSTIKYHASRGLNDLLNCDGYKMFEYLNQPGIVERSNYMHVIQKWMNHVNEDQFLLLFYDDIISRPEYVNQQVNQFLGVGSDQPLELSTMREKVNQSLDLDMPVSIRTKLYNYYYQNIEELSNVFGGAANAWLHYAKTYRK